MVKRVNPFWFGESSGNLDDTDMTPSIKIESDDTLRKFSKKAVQRYGYKKGTIEKAVEIAIKVLHVRARRLSILERREKELFRPTAARALVESRLVLLGTRVFGTCR